MSLSKAKAGVLGGLVGDAASMPLHWIYENAKLLETVGDKKVLISYIPLSTYVTMLPTCNVPGCCSSKRFLSLKNAQGTPEFFETPSCPFYGTKDFPGHYQTGQVL